MYTNRISILYFLSFIIKNSDIHRITTNSLKNMITNTLILLLISLNLSTMKGQMVSVQSNAQAGAHAESQSGQMEPRMSE